MIQTIEFIIIIIIMIAKFLVRKPLVYRVKPKIKVLFNNSF